MPMRGWKNEPTTGLAAGIVGLLGVLVVVLCNCAGNNIARTAAPQVQPAADQAAVPGTTPVATTAASASNVYKISPRDIVDVSVFQVPDLTKTVQVSEDGNVTLPLVGKVGFGGKTTHEAEEELATKLKAKYLQSPQVSILIKQFGQRVTVSGEVKTPRVFPIDGAVTLSEAIANAGGLGDLADVNRVHVARTRSGHVTDHVYDLAAIQSGKATDPVLQGGDLVVAEQSGSLVALKNVKDLLPFAVLATVL